MKDEFKRASAQAIACCWECDGHPRTEDKRGVRQLHHQLARARMKRELTEELSYIRG